MRITIFVFSLVFSASAFSSMLVDVKACKAMGGDYRYEERLLNFSSEDTAQYIAETNRIAKLAYSKKGLAEYFSKTKYDNNDVTKAKKVMAAAKCAKIDLAVMLNLIRLESKFNESACSTGKGGAKIACGIMQVTNIARTDIDNLLGDPKGAGTCLTGMEVASEIKDCMLEEFSKIDKTSKSSWKPLYKRSSSESKHVLLQGDIDSGLIYGGIYLHHKLARESERYSSLDKIYTEGVRNYNGGKYLYNTKAIFDRLSCNDQEKNCYVKWIFDWVPRMYKELVQKRMTADLSFLKLPDHLKDYLNNAGGVQEEVSSVAGYLKLDALLLQEYVNEQGDRLDFIEGLPTNSRENLINDVQEQMEEQVSEHTGVNNQNVIRLALDLKSLMSLSEPEFLKGEETKFEVYKNFLEGNFYFFIDKVKDMANAFKEEVKAIKDNLVKKFVFWAGDRQ